MIIPRVTRDTKEQRKYNRNLKSVHISSFFIVTGFILELTITHYFYLIYWLLAYSYSFQSARHQSNSLLIPLMINFLFFFTLLDCGKRCRHRFSFLTLSVNQKLNGFHSFSRETMTVWLQC